MRTHNKGLLSALMLVLAVLALCPARASADSWRTRAPMPTARRDFATAVYDGKIYAIGGYAAGEVALSTNEVYDPATDAWATRASMPTARAAARADVVAGRICVVGGETGVNAFLATNECYDPVTNTWETKASMSGVRSDPGVVAVDNHLFVLGGWNVQWDPPLASAEKYSVLTDSWIPIAAMSVGRYTPGVAVSGGKIYVAGGDGGGGTRLASAEVYDVASDGWTSLPDMSQGRSHLTMAALGGWVYSIGGISAALASVRTIEGYNTGTGTWTLLPDMPTERMTPAAAAVDGKIYVIGGQNASDYLSVNEEYTPSPPALVYESFENTAAGNSPENWSVYYSGVSHVVSTDRAQEGNQSAFLAAGMFNAVSIDRDISGLNITSGTYRLRSHVYVDSASFTGTGSHACSGVVLAGNYAGICVQKADPGFALELLGAATQTVAFPAAPDSWVRYEMIFAVDTNTVDYYVNGTLVGSGAGGANASDRINININAGGGGSPSAYFDAISLEQYSNDTVPETFAFIDSTGAQLSKVVHANSFTVSGLTAPAPISIIGGQYSVNGGAFTAAPTTVANGDQVAVRATSAATYATTVDATLTIGGVSDTFSVTTMDLSAGLAARYTFDGGANDSSGNNLHGIVTGAILVADRFGNPSSAYQFAGNSSTYIRVPRNALLEPVNGLTLSFWMKRLGAGHAAQMIVRKSDNCAAGYDVQGDIASRILGPNACGGEAVGALAGYSGDVGTWNYYAVTYGTSTGIRIYRNGVLVASSAALSPSMSHSGDLYIGGAVVHQDDGGLNGLLDDLRVYSRALSEAEIAELNADRPVNSAPAFVAIGNRTVEEAATLAFTVSATDAPGDTLAYSATGLPTGAALDPSTGAFSWTPTYAQAGTYPVTFQVSDGSLTDSEAVTITVGNALYEGVQSFGSYGAGVGQLNAPMDVALDAAMNVYVADFGNNRIVKFDAAGGHLSTWGTLGAGPGQFNGPHAVEVDGPGYIYVGDRDNARVEKFDQAQSYVLEWSWIGDIANLAKDSDGNIYVTSAQGNKLRKYNPTGAFLFEWDLSTPWGVAVDAAGFVYVAEYFNQRVLKLDQAGAVVSVIGSGGSGAGQFQGPSGVAVDPEGNIFVADLVANRVLKFDALGNFLLAWGEYGSGPGQLYGPRGLALDPQGGVYVTDPGNNRIQKFRPYNSLNEGLVAHYALDGGAVDSSGNGNDGTVYGATPATDRFGNPNSAYLFDGVNDYITVPDSATLNPAQVTYAMWVNLPSNAPFWGAALAEKDGWDAGSTGCLLAVGGWSGDNTVRWEKYNPSWQVLDSTVKLSLNNWHHVAASFDGTTLKIFIDGQLDSSLSAPGSISAGNDGIFGMGARFNDTTVVVQDTFLTGRIDDYRIYNRALSDAEVAQLAADRPDLVPDQFAFTDQTGVAREILADSAPVAVVGITGPAPVSITGGEYSIAGVNGGAFTSAPGTVVNGDQVTVRVTSAATYGTTVNATLTIGGVSDTFSVTTLSAFVFFDDFESYPLGSNPTSVYEFDGASWGGGGDPQPQDLYLVGTAGANHVLRYENPNGWHHPLSLKLYRQVFTLIDEVKTTFYYEQASSGFSRVRFAYQDINHGYDVLTLYTNDLRIYCDGALLGLVSLWPDVNIMTVSHRIEVKRTGPTLTATVYRLDTNEWKSVGVDSTAYLGGRAGFGFSEDVVGPGIHVIVDDFFVRGTPSGAAEPLQFSFTDKTGVGLNSPVTSNAITVSGISTLFPISITGGEYSVNGGAWTSSLRTVADGDQVTVRVTSAVTFATTVDATLTIGGVSDTFSVTTMPSPTGPYKIPDAGQAKCYQDASPWLEIPCAGTGQDGAYSVNPLSYADNLDGSVTDNNTGLIWQRQDDGVTYNWYQATGTYDASSNSGSQDVCASKTTGGHTDWRLPTKRELMSIVDYAIPASGPVVRTAFLQGMSADNYWSSTPDASLSSDAWHLDFSSGGVFAVGKNNTLHVRCVRGGQAESPNHLADGVGRTVTDSTTGLAWQKDEGGIMAWGAAVAYCSGLDLAGDTDWRLPNAKELESLSDGTRSNPAIDTAYFPGAGSSSYWSSTSFASNPALAWHVYFADGYVDAVGKNGALSVRCVRGGQPGVPGQFAFTDRTGVGLSVLVVSNPIGVSGITGPSLISITGGEYSVNGAAYTSASGTVVNGDQVTVRQTSSASYVTQVDATLTIGGISDTFSVTTMAQFEAGQVAHYRFDGNAGDAVGTNHGESHSMTWGADRYGVPGRAAQFNQGTSYVRVPSSAALELTAEGTWSFWMKPAADINHAVADRPHLFGKGAAYFERYADYAFWLEPGKGTFEMAQASNARAYAPGPSYGQTDWVHLTVTYKDGKATVYVNGGSPAQQTTYPALFTSTRPLYIGCRYLVNGSPYAAFKGEIDDLRVYNRALSALEVAALHQAEHVDNDPDAFSFVDQTGVAPSTSAVSNAVTVAGITSDAPISVTGGEYSINGGPYTAAAGRVTGGDSVVVRVTSSVSYATTVDATLAIGGVSDTFSVTTLVIESSTWPVVQGYDEFFEGDWSNWAVIEDRKGPEYAALASVNEDGTGLNYSLQTPGNSVRADSVLKRVFRGSAIRFDVSWLWNGNGTVELFVTDAAKVSSGHLEDYNRYTVFAGSHDVPNLWIYAIQNGVYSIPGIPAAPSVEGNAPYIGQVVTVTVRKQGSEWSYFRDGQLLNTVSIPELMDKDVSLILAPSHNSYKGGTATFQFTQIKVTVEDSSPEPFSFTDLAGVALSTPITSDPVTVAGINVPVPISVVGGEYSVNGGGFTAVSGSVANGNQVAVRLTSSPFYGVTTDATLTIGGVIDTFSVTTPDNPANQAPTDIALSNASVAENEAPATPVGTLTTTDADPGDTFTYALVNGLGGTDNDSFQIAGNTVLTAATFDFEAKSAYSIRVQSTDHGGLMHEKVLSILVTNVNEPPTDIGAGAFYEDFSSDLAKWTPFGSPVPQIVLAAQGRSGVFDNAGDPNHNSGAVSRFLVGSADGFTIETEVYLDFSSLAGCWASAGIGLTKLADPLFGPSGQNEEYGLVYSLDANGDACWGTPVQYRGHAYLGASILADDGTYEGSPAYAFTADQYAGGWHVMKIQVDPDRGVKFFIDGALLWSPAKKLHPTMLEGRNLVIGHRSSGSAGKAYHDWVKVTPAGASPLLLLSKGAVGGGDTDIYSMRGDGGGQRLVHDSAGAAASARWSKSGGRIVFNSTASTTGAAEIFSVKADGSDLRQLTANADAFGSSQARFVSDDTKIWFWRGSSPGTSEIWEMGPDGSGPIQLTAFELGGTQAGAFELDASGARVYYGKESPSWSPSSEIHAASADFSGETRLTTNGAADAISDVSPDGTQILLHRSESANGYDGPYNIYAMNASGGGERRLTAATGSQGCFSAIWSPDGTQIAYSCFDGAQWDVHVMNADGSAQRKITDTPGINESASDWEIPGGADTALVALSVEENKPVGALVGMLSTVDTDGVGTFTYTLAAGAGDTDNASFQITGSDLRAAEVFDYEMKNLYSVRVRTTDEGGLWHEKAITVNVTNLVETDPGNVTLTFAGASFTLSGAAGADLCTGSVGTAAGPYLADNNYVISDAQLADVDGDGTVEAVVLAHHAANFPAQVAVFNLTCALERRYWHPGHLFGLAFGDTNADGTPEILVGGTNEEITGLDVPVVLALDGSTMTGEAPPRYGNIGTGTELWYRVLGNTESAAIRKLTVAGSTLVCNTLADGTGTEYVVRLADGSPVGAPLSIPLAEAVDNGGFAFQTGGAASWAGQSTVFHGGGDAARSGMIFDGQSTWFTATLNGPGQGSFWWKVSSEASFDTLRFTIDGVLVAEISGEAGWQQEVWSVDTAGAHVLRWEYAKDAVFAAGSDSGWVDEIVIGALPTGSILIDGGAAYADSSAVSLTLSSSDPGVQEMMFSNDQGAEWSAPEPFAPTKAWTLTPGDGNKVVSVKFRDSLGIWSAAFSDSILVDTTNLGNAVDNLSLAFSTGGDAAWSRRTIVFHNDGDAAQSEAVGDLRKTWFETTVVAPAGSFWWKVSSEASYDFLRFYVDGKREFEISGEVDWQQVFWSVGTGGSHVLRWEYAKDVNIAAGADAGWVDQVVVGALPSGSIAIAGGAASTSSPQVTLSLSAADSDGIAEMKFSNDQTGQWSAGEPYAPTKSWALSTGDGVKKVHVRFRDGVGNWSNSFNDTVVLDTQGPVGTVQVNAGAAGTSSATVQLALAWTDPNGCSLMQLGEDGVFDTEPSRACAPAVAWTLTPGEGTRKVFARFRDGLGTWSGISSDSIVLDAVSPTVSIASPARNVTVKQVLEIGGAAADANLARVELKVSDGAYHLRPDGGWSNSHAAALEWLPASGTTSWALDTSRVVWANGKQYHVRARAVDVAGTTAETSSQFTYEPSDAAYTQLSLVLSTETILQTQTIDISGKLTRLPASAADLSNKAVVVTVTDPDNMPVPLTVIDDQGSAVSVAQALTYHTLGQYQLRNITGFVKKGVYRIGASFAGSSGLAPAEAEEQYVLVGAESGYAIVVEGRVPNDEEGLAAHNKTANRVYRALAGRGFADQNIYYFNYEKDQDEDRDGRADGLVDEVPTWDGVRRAVVEWAGARMRVVPAPLYLVLVDHGSVDSFHLDDAVITPADLDGWLDQLEASLAGTEASREPRVVVNGSCYSGSFIPVLSKEGRVVVTSAAADEQSYKGPNEPGGRSGEFFLEEFFKDLDKGSSLRDAFASATEKTEQYTKRGGLSANDNGRYRDSSAQHPLLDDDGDGVGSNLLSDDDGDGRVADAIYLGVGKTNAVGNPAEFASVSGPRFLGPTQSSAKLGAGAISNGEVAAAWIEVREPSKELAGNGGTGQLPVDITREFLTLKEDSGRWECGGDPEALNQDCTYTFGESGAYEVFYFTQRTSTGEVSSMKRSLVYKDKAGNSAPGAFGLLAPGEGDDAPTVLLLDWDESVDPDGDALTYTVVISEDASFTTEAYRREELQHSAAEIGLAAKLKDLTDYYWKVVAIDCYGAVRESTEVRRFRTNNANPGIPGFVVGCVTDAVSFRGVASPSVTASSAAALVQVFPSGCFSIYGQPGGLNIAVSASGYRTRAVSASVPPGTTSRVNVSLMPIHLLGVAKAGNGAGAVTSVPAGISCGATCAKTFDSGTSVTLRAAPTEGSIFVGWTGACTGVAECTVSMTQARSVSPRFVLATQTLTVSTTGSGAGEVVVDQGALAWVGGVGTASYPYDTTVVLTAREAAGSYFNGWTGACAGFGTAPVCTVQLSDTRAAVAEFKATIQELQVTVQGAGSGIVRDDRSALAWQGNIGSASFDYGTVVTLRAWADSGSIFGGWSGGACGSAPTCTVTMTGRREVAAIFAPSGGSVVTTHAGGLTVNGAAFTVKGVVYAPVPVGADPGVDPPYGDYFTAAHSGIYDRDLEVLRGMNANTVRILAWDSTAEHADFLNKAYNGGTDPIYVIPGFWIDPGLDIDPVSSGNVREQLKTGFRDMVAAHKGHPAILMWAIGSELNGPHMYAGDLDNLFSLVEELAREAHAEDSNHPVTTPLADSDLAATIAAYDGVVPSLDLWGANVVRGASFGTLFADYKAASSKPLVITAYGADAYDNAAGAEDETSQADRAAALWGEIAANDDVCAGATILEYSDEWWQGRLAAPSCADAGAHEPCGAASAAQPDEFDNFEWWGIVGVSDGGDGPDTVTPRAVYGRLRNLFWSAAGSVVINGGTTYTRSTSVELALKAQPEAVEMCVSNAGTCTGWEPIRATRTWTLEPGDGVKKVNVWFRDGEGSTTDVPSSGTIVLDTVAPAGGTASGTAGPAQITVSWGGFFDDGSDVGSYTLVFAPGAVPATCATGSQLFMGSGTSFTHTGLTNAIYGYRVCARDRAGNVSSGAVWSGRPARESGVPTGSVIINGGDEATRRTLVTLALAASDDSPPLQMCVSNTTICTTWTAFSPAKAWVLPAGNGMKTVYVWYRDAWGNRTPVLAPHSDRIGLDAAPPVNGTVTAVPGPGKIDLSWGGFDDTLSGIVDYKVVYKVGAAPLTCATGTVLPGCAGGGTSCPHNGLINVTYGYRVCAIDKAGNISTGAVKTARPLPSEAVAPTGSVLINGDDSWAKRAVVTLTVGADDVSNPIQMCVSNTAACTAWVAWAPTKVWTLAPGNGTRTVRVWLRDTWRNTTAAPLSDSIEVDATPPVNGTLLATAGAGQIDLSWSGFSDTLSGVVDYKVVYKVGAAPLSCATGTELTQCAGGGTSCTHAGLINATYGYRVCAIDKAGNVSTGATKTAKPTKSETVAPVGSVLINGGATATKAAAVTLTLTATDSTPPVQMCISNTATCTAWVAFAPTKAWTLAAGNGTKTVNVWFRDTWLNATPVANPFTDTIVLDTVAPTNGTVMGMSGDQQVALSWDPFTDPGSGVASYKAVFSAVGMPATCAAGTPVPELGGTLTTRLHIGLTNGKTYYYRVCAIDNAGMVSTGATWSGKPGL